MAIDKSRTAPIVKIGIGVLAAFLIIGVSSSIIPGIAEFFSPTTGAQSDQTGGGAYASAAAEYGPRVTGLEQQLASDPASFTVLATLGNEYFNWAAAVANDQTAPQGAATPYWTLTITYYERALQVQSEPALETDLAIAYDYSGRLDNAVARAQKTVSTTPTFSPAFYHLGRFLERKGDIAGATAALNRYLAMDPEGKTMGGDPADAKAILARMAAGTSSVPASPTP